ncbi:hypothetical protein K505DRAFT_417280 [Melanomma pulvis-pyrius CBS 109.77]|uniref:Uncharacterized protein n=1 Tax=Melanomma pulvis-pyrius CBS 109.77 TaxID=1314802 RepID=A0A6A6XCH9_9PLEO|nr:hypothetical protein K505DRAFT_417280 [Melanomma pulvis-pyrius CBS 109.77]
MRFSHFSILALSGLSLASPVLERRADAVSLLTDLYATIQTYTGAINATLAPLSVSSSPLEKAAALTDVGASLSSITDALKAATSSVKAITPGSASKRSALSPSTIDAQAEPVAKRQLVEVGVILALILVELFATIAGAIAILGLAGLLVFLNPLTSALALLILAVEVLVDALLIAVIVLLDTLLTGLAIGIGGL